MVANSWLAAPAGKNGAAWPRPSAGTVRCQHAAPRAGPDREVGGVLFCLAWVLLCHHRRDRPGYCDSGRSPLAILTVGPGIVAPPRV